MAEEVGATRALAEFFQPRAAEAATPFLEAGQVATTLIVFAVVYTFIFSAGVIYIYRLLRRGPAATPDSTTHEFVPPAGSSSAARPSEILLAKESRS